MFVSMEQYKERALKDIMKAKKDTPEEAERFFKLLPTKVEVYHTKRPTDVLFTGYERGTNKRVVGVFNQSQVYAGEVSAAMSMHGYSMQVHMLSKLICSFY